MKGPWLFLVVLGSLLPGLTGCAAPLGLAEPAQSPTASVGSETGQRARLRMELASRYLENGQPHVALDEVQLSLAADPRYVPALVLRGLIHMRLHNGALAEASFERALQIDPRHPDALHNHGWYLCEQGRHAQALALFSRALELPAYEGQAKTWMAQGVCQLRMGQLAQAESSFLRSHELDAGHPVPAYNLAELLFRRNQDQQARPYLQRLNHSDLANAQTLWLGLRVERRLRHTDAMEQLAQRLRQHFADSPEWALYQRGAFDE